MFRNAFFKIDDVHNNNVAGLSIRPVWWSRQYEYPWAFEYVKHGTVAADMGCGYTMRPFKNMMATKCKKVYAVDAREEARSQKISEDNIELIISDFSKIIPNIAPESLDRVFC